MVGGSEDHKFAVVAGVSTVGPAVAGLTVASIEGGAGCIVVGVNGVQVDEIAGFKFSNGTSIGGMMVAGPVVP